MSLSKRNRRGFFIVLLLLLIVSYTPRIINAFNKSPDFKFSHQQLIEAEKELKIKAEKSKKNKYSKHSKKKKYIGLTEKTDPNTLSKSDWIKLGVSKKQASSIINFSKRGLRSNADLKKIYVLPTELYDLIKDSLIYPEIKNNFSKTNQYEESSDDIKFIAIELNGSTQEELETIPGIGPFFAKNILKRKKELGGFSNKQQLLEIWKFDQVKYDEINDFIFVDKETIDKININLASIDELKIHPYISYKVANSIVKMREMRGGYEDINEVTESMLINEELYIKLLPYLEL